MWTLLALLETLLGKLEDLGVGLAVITGGRGGDILVLDSTLESVLCVLQHSVCAQETDFWNKPGIEIELFLLTPLWAAVGSKHTVDRRNQEAFKHSKPSLSLLLVF